ncbi:MAG: hypothetical protein LBI06_06310 [Treponema sp.]|nr:hypothetical protein [Treponema sp.]
MNNFVSFIDIMEKIISIIKRILIQDEGKKLKSGLITWSNLIWKKNSGKWEWKKYEPMRTCTMTSANIWGHCLEGNERERKDIRPEEWLLCYRAIRGNIYHYRA